VDFFSIILFLMLYYIRPHEWSDLISQMRPITVAVALAITSLFTGDRSLKREDFLKTPHDWMMLALFLWTVGTSPDKWQTFLYVYNGFVFYWITVLTLVSIRRIRLFLNWWTVLIFLMAAFALASEYGFDPTSSYSLTHGRMKERLTLNTSIFNNPNALGHSVVPAVVMLYFTAFWKRPIFVKIFSPLVIALPVYCIFLTQSKGAFMAGFATIVNALIFKRPKAVQVLILVIALTAGWAGLSLMPRMNELDASKSDEAIQGRIHAFHFGYARVNDTLTGVGYANFEKAFSKEYHYVKASHSSYVRVGGELGFPGLFIFLGVIYCSLHTLFFAKTNDDTEERIRRILFVLFVSYLVSSWMVDYANRATFFLMAAATAAFHRCLLSPSHSAEPESSVAELEPLSMHGAGQLPTLIFPATPALTAGGDADTENSAPPAPGTESGLPAATAGVTWNRITKLDLLLIFLLTLGTMAFWRYVMNKM
jgi:hypothetical protein